MNDNNEIIVKKNSGYTTIVIHANTVTEEDQERYRQLFASYGKDMISYNEYIKVKPVNRSIAGRMVEYIMAKCKFILVKIKK